MRGEIHLVLGRRGVGKTTLATELARRAIRDAALRLPRPPWWERYGLRGLGGGGAPSVRVVVFDPRYQVSVGRLTPRVPGRIDVQRVVAADALDQVGLVQDVVLLDEVDLLAGPTSIHPTVMHWANYGRHDGVTLIMTARRPARVHRDLTALADYIHVGRVTEPRDVRYLVEVVGEEARAVAQLKLYEFKHFHL